MEFIASATASPSKALLHSGCRQTDMTMTEAMEPPEPIQSRQSNQQQSNSYVGRKDISDWGPEG